MALFLRLHPLPNCLDTAKKHLNMSEKICSSMSSNIKKIKNVTCLDIKKFNYPKNCQNIRTRANLAVPGFPSISGTLIACH